MPKSDAALIAEFDTLVRVPQFLQEQFNQMQSDRDYIKNVMEHGSADDVTVNHVYRNMKVIQSSLGVQDFAPIVQPARTVGGIYDPIQEAHAETLEIFLERQIKLTGLRQQLEGAAMDSMVNKIAFLLVTLQEDFYKDPVGANRFNDQQDNIALYMSLKKQKPEPNTPEYQKLQDLEATLKEWAIAELIGTPKTILIQDPITGQTQAIQDPTDPRSERVKAIMDGEEFDVLGLPEVARYLGFQVTQLQPEDVRFDWSVTRAEDWPQAQWVAYRAFVDKDTFMATFGEDAEDFTLGGIKLFDTNGVRVASSWEDSEAPSRRDQLEVSERLGRAAVWTLYHRTLGRRYVWADGMDTFLVNEAITAVGSHFFPIFPLQFNRVPGQLIGFSNVELQRDLNDEYNTLRTNDREARRAAYPTLVAAAGSMSKKDVAAYENRQPFSVLFLSRPDKVKEYIEELPGVPYNPNLYNASAVMGDMQMMAGIPFVMTGMQSSAPGQLATDTSLATQGFQRQLTDYQDKVQKLGEEILLWMSQVAAQVFPADNIAQMCGQGAVWPQMSAEQLQVQYSIEITGTLAPMQAREKEMSLWTNFGNMARALGLPMNGIAVAQELLKVLGVRKDLRRFLAAPPAPPEGGMVPPPVPDQGGRPAGQPIESPEQIPNNRMGFGKATAASLEPAGTPKPLA